MTRDTIADRVVTLIRETLRLDTQQITATSRFIEDLGANSLDIAQMLSLVEGEFERIIPDDRLAELHTVGDLVTLLQDEHGERRQ